MRKSGEGLKLYEEKMMKMVVEEEEILTDNLRPLHYLCPPIFSLPRSPPTLDDLFDEGRFFGRESLNDARNDLWDDAKFETDYNKSLKPVSIIF